jgi:hypothetical protein
MLKVDSPSRVDIPPALYEAIRGFLHGEKHGNITLNVKQGKIISWAITEVGRIDKTNY